jgi:hypothetical protein
VSRSLGSRLALFTATLTFAMVWCTAAAPAAIEMSAGLRHVVQSAPDGECSAKAKEALNSSLQNAFETAPGNGIWMAYGQLNSQGHTSSAAVIHCYPLGGGYTATYTCSVELPTSPFSASDLCNRLYASMTNKTAAALATPTPEPTGCSLTNLVGTWTADDKNGAIFKFDENGGLVDNEGVSGNWALNGNQASLVYYGTHPLTLSADGKHLVAPRGTPLNFTRQC